MRFFDGLYIYEIILIVLGVLLFLVLLLALVVLLMRRQSYGKILMSFVIPIVMVGFPGIKSFEISEGVIKVENKTQALQQNPTDKGLRESLAEEVANLSSRPIADSQASITIARAQVALGDSAAAETRIEKALKEAPQLPEAVELKRRLELDRNLAALISHVEQNPADTATKTRLESTVNEVARLPVASPETLVNIARAQKALGDHTQAQETVEKALTINPNLAPAIQLRRQMETNTVPHRSDNR